jgi:hypothetical protein
VKKYLALLLILVACAPTPQPLSAPIPNPTDLLSIKAERTTITGFDEPNTPNQFDQAIFVRY